MDQKKMRVFIGVEICLPFRPKASKSHLAFRQENGGRNIKGRGRKELPLRLMLRRGCVFGFTAKRRGNGFRLWHFGCRDARWLAKVESSKSRAIPEHGQQERTLK